jgi:hypothetical protein
MAAMATAAETRWDFLSPWCQFVHTRIDFVWSAHEEEVWDSPKRRLEVHLPTRRDVATPLLASEPAPVYPDNSTFSSDFQTIRETLALLATVAHVDPNGWKYLLKTYCGVSLGSEGEEIFEEEIPVRFLLSIFDGKYDAEHMAELEEDLVFLFGVHQRTDPSQEYVTDLKKVARLDTKLRRGEAGTDVLVPVQVWLSAFDAALPLMTGAVEPLETIAKAEKRVKEDWERYNRTSIQQPVPEGTLRCTFVLKPTKIDLSDYIITSELAGLLERLVRENTRFSQLSLLMYIERERMIDERAAKVILGQLMARVFDSTRRPEQPLGPICHVRRPWGAQDPLQMAAAHIQCEDIILPLEFEAMCSAMVVNQTTRKLSVHLETKPDDPTASAHWWKWLAYALFSNRARSSSALESLAIISIASMSAADMEAFAAVVTSEHPEEELSGCPRGVVRERDATLKAGAPIRWRFNKQGRPRRGFRALTFEHDIPLVRAFSDDGESGWVNVLVPGYGRCQVQREDLAFDENPRAANAGSGGVTSLRIGFDKLDPSDSTGLPEFLRLVGGSLRELTLDGPMRLIDVNEILQSCPKLEILSFLTFFVDIRLDVRDCHSSTHPFPSVGRYWREVGLLAAALTDRENPLKTCARRLRVRLIDQWAGWDVIPDGQFPAVSEADFEALLRMLEGNRDLQYFEAVVSPIDFTYFDAFRAHHRTPTNHALKVPMESKAAFLSVASGQAAAVSQVKTKKAKMLRQRSVLCDLDHHALSKIFEFAASPVLRKVYFNQTYDNWEDELVQVVI